MEQIIDDDEPERKVDDEFYGKRQHFWIMILKSDIKRIPDTLFIDPASSSIWKLSNKALPFLKVDQIFNQRTIWINVDNEKDLGELDIENFQEQSNFVDVLEVEEKNIQEKI